MALDLIVQHVHSQLEKVTNPPSYLFYVSEGVNDSFPFLPIINTQHEKV